MTHRKLAAALFLLASPLALPAEARATYSITAADAAAKEVGGAGASCVPYEVIRIYGVAKGRGAVNAQAYFDDEALALSVQMLEDGAAPADILAEITDPASHPVAPKMQWGIVDALGRSARATGPMALAFAADDGDSSADGRFIFTVQGNILTSALVLSQMREGFEAEGCDLADKLVRGLEAAGANGEGDSRCTDEGRPAKSAYVDVTGTSGSRLLISIPDVSPTDPIPLLRAQYDTWREAHPCPKTEGPKVENSGDAPTAACSCALPNAPLSVSPPLSGWLFLLLAAALRIRKRCLR